MMSEEEIIELHNGLGIYGILVWGTIMHLEKEGKKLTMGAIHARSIEYMLKNKIKIGEGSSIATMLPILATFDKTTQVWNLKSNAKILQTLRAKHETKRQKNPK